MRANDLVAARWVALLLPLALVGGAWASQLIGGLHPCEMCLWQRWPHYAAIALAALAFLVPRGGGRRLLVFAAALAIAISGAIGLFHAGVEYDWWEGITGCTSGLRSTGNAADMLAQIMNAPVIRCDVPQWTLFGISLAGWNALLSLGGAAAIVMLATRRRA